MTGDMDPIAVLDENGQILDLDRRLEVYKDLAKMGFQHPESLTWDNAAERAKYLFDFDLANGKGRALLAYGPDGTRRAGVLRLAQEPPLRGPDDARRHRHGDGGDEGREGRGAGDRGAGDGRRASLHHAGRGERRGPDAVAGRPAHPSQPGRHASRSGREAGGWQPYTLPGGQTVTTLPQTSVRTAAAAGETRIDINDAVRADPRAGRAELVRAGRLRRARPGRAERGVRARSRRSARSSPRSR